MCYDPKQEVNLTGFLVLLYGASAKIRVDCLSFKCFSTCCIVFGNACRGDTHGDWGPELYRYCQLVHLLRPLQIPRKLVVPPELHVNVVAEDEGNIDSCCCNLITLRMCGLSPGKEAEVLGFRV